MGRRSRRVGGGSAGAARGVVAVGDRRLVAQVALVEAIAAQKRQLVAADQNLTRLVRRARRAGVPWREVGRALGVTFQTAQGRYGPYPVKASKRAQGGSSGVAEGVAGD